MSGEIFQPPESLDDVDVIRWNPLMCYLCNGKYEDPCILGCYHSFCSRCLRGRAVEGKMACPLCQASTALKEGENLPSPDKLLKFLVTSSCEEREQCANCDSEMDQMYFCNTCAQPLCEPCREETHKAKMFARHEIVVLSKRTKEIHRECLLHGEPYILFSAEKKTMLCINCFRDMKMESRSYCVDMETAYHQSCQKLDQRMQAIKELQNSVRDSILLLRALLEEITQNSELEKSAITELYNSMQNKITDTKDALLKEVDRQYKDKEKLFTEELASLSTLLPTLHTHLVTCAAFSSSANKFEFLDLAYMLMERLKSIIHLQYPLHPSQGSQICTNFKGQFAKCLEPLLFPQRNSAVLSSTAAGSLSSVGSSAPRLETKMAVPVSSVRSNTPLQNGRRHMAISKLKITDGKGVFAEHCRDFDKSHKNLSQMVERLKSHLQELQRDLTLRRCLTRQTVMEELQTKVEQVEQKLDEHKSNVENKRPLLEKHWEECVQRIAGEQEIYQVQLQDVNRIYQETSHLRTILNQLSRFVTSITALTERLAPKLASSAKESNHDNQVAAIFEQINTMQPDSQHRVDAIRTAEEEREILSANRTNPLDEELIKTKSLLKAPSARRDGIPRRESTKRDTGEVKEDKSGSCNKHTVDSAGKDGIFVKENSGVGQRCTEENKSSSFSRTDLIDLDFRLAEFTLDEGDNRDLSKCAKSEKLDSNELCKKSSMSSSSIHVYETGDKDSKIALTTDSIKTNGSLSPRSISVNTDISQNHVFAGKLSSNSTSSMELKKSDDNEAADNKSDDFVASDNKAEAESNDKEDDMTGGETVRARIEKLRDSIDTANGSRSPKDKVSEQMNDMVSSVISSAVPVKCDHSVSVGVLKTEDEYHDQDIKSSVEKSVNTVSHSTGRRRRRVKTDQVGEQAKNKEETINELTSEAENFQNTEKK